MNDTINTILSRRSVRAYTSQQLTQEEIDLILEAGRYAPSAHNEQPWHFTVVQNTELLDSCSKKAKAEMAELDDEWMQTMGKNEEAHLTYHAPTVIFLSARDGGMGMQTDTCAAAQNMMLAAESLGLGSVWVGLLWFYLGLPEAPAELRVPAGYKPMHAVAFGHASGPKLPAPVRNPNVVTYIR